ncbi:conjugative coupling factor TraD, PFGI-1 class [Serratia fonticola]|uniref:Conjugative coupling factor TraD, PFGI-1 class n=1 Tax=Serratia fonticola TaxID=47917 RepID=A0A4U9UWD4_SERFO|nr:conjugative coupling factor TraD, PFGI-1 class [Serratia fonticola]
MTKQLPEVEVYTKTLVSGVTDISNPEMGSDFTSNTQDRVSSVRTPLITPANVINLPKGQAFALLEGGKLWKIRMPLPAVGNDALMPESLGKIAEYMKKKFIARGIPGGRALHCRETGHPRLTITWFDEGSAMKQQYRVSAVLASSLGQSAEVPHDIMTVLKARHCSTPFAPEIVTVLSELGYDARREQEPCPANQVGSGSRSIPSPCCCSVSWKSWGYIKGQGNGTSIFFPAASSAKSAC